MSQIVTDEVKYFSKLMLLFLVGFAIISMLSPNLSPKPSKLDTQTKVINDETVVIDSDAVACGGWSPLSKVICDCDGEYKKPGCPKDTVCDGATYYCSGTCGACKCYRGGTKEIPCIGFNEDGSEYNLLLQ